MVSFCVEDRKVLSTLAALLTCFHTQAGKEASYFSVRYQRVRYGEELWHLVPHIHVDVARKGKKEVGFWFAYHGDNCGYALRRGEEKLFTASSIEEIVAGLLTILRKEMDNK